MSRFTNFWSRVLRYLPGERKGQRAGLRLARHLSYLHHKPVRPAALRLQLKPALCSPAWPSA